MVSIINSFSGCFNNIRTHIEKSSTEYKIIMAATCIFSLITLFSAIHSLVRFKREQAILATARNQEPSYQAFLSNEGSQVHSSLSSKKFKPFEGEEFHI